jgi:hypothetical protein
MKYCSEKYESWVEDVLKDWEENAEFNSEAQMDKFKSRMLRGMELVLEKIPALSDTVQNQHLEILQIKTICKQLMLQNMYSEAAEERVRRLS